MTRTRARLVRITGGILAGAIVLTGCSGGGDASGAGASPSSAETPAEESAAFNDADVTFVQGMIPHHRGAIEMSQLAEGRAEDPRVLDTANRIEAAQEPEIETMTAWLEEWGEPLPEDSGDMGGMDHGSMDTGGMDMEGMSAEDMAALEAASGAEFDRTFLQMMIGHHRGAVAMAQTEIAEGSNPDAVALAREVVDTQDAEIQEMEALLAELGG